MRTPKPSELKDPILEILADGKMWQFMEIVEELAIRLNLTKADRERERFPNGNDRLPRYCANALSMLRDKDHLVENPARGSWRIISLTVPQKTNQRQRPSKSHDSAPMLNPISVELMNDKKTKIRNRSRRKSYYGKRVGQRQLTGQKQRAIERGRVREVKSVEPVQEPKPIEKITPMEKTEKKIPWRGPRSKSKYDPGTYVLRGCGCTIVGSVFLLGFFVSSVPVFYFENLYFLMVALFCIGVAIHSFANSRGGW